MNVYLTSLMHPDTANDFSEVLKNFTLTARSVCAQTDQSFTFFVVCNGAIDIEFTHPSIVYFPVDFPPADRAGGIELRRLDKATKLLAGLLALTSYDPVYVHIIDADDWVASDHNAWLRSRPVHPIGYNFGVGHLVDLSTGRYLRKYGLNRYCGSTFATNYRTLMDRMGASALLGKRLSQQEIKDSFGEPFLRDLFPCHGYRELFALTHEAYGQCWRPKISWVRNTGENILGQHGDIDFGVPVNTPFLNRYGLGGQRVLPAESILGDDWYLLNGVRRYRDLLQSYVGSILARPRPNLFADHRWDGRPSAVRGQR